MRGPRSRPTAAALIERAGPACVAVKPQLACFERLGAPGWAALDEVCEAARAPGCWWSPTASAATSRSPPPPTRRRWSARRRRPGGRSPGSAPTPSPSTRCSAATRWSRWSTRPRRPEPGVFALVRTSNPGAADLQDLPAPERPLHERLAALVDGLSDRLLGERRPQWDGGGGGRDRARAPGPAARADAALDLPHSRGRRAGRQAGVARRGLRGGTGLRASWPPRAASPPTPTRRRPRSACGTPFGRFRPRKSALSGYTIIDAHPILRSRPMQKRSTAPARALALVALVAAFLVLIVVVANSLGGGDSTGSGRNSSSTTTTQKKRKGPDQGGLRRPERRHADCDRPQDRRLGRAHPGAQPERRPADPHLRREAEAAVTGNAVRRCCLRDARPCRGWRCRGAHP